MTTPGKLFLNLYKPGIGGAIGAAYETREQADRAANSSRLRCVEVTITYRDGRTSVAMATVAPSEA